MSTEKARVRARVCNLCGEEKKSAGPRLQYPAFACAPCYRKWKLGPL